MVKFLKINNFLIAVNGIVGVDQTGATTTVITYYDGLIATLTHGSLADPGFQTALNTVIERAMQTPWDKPVYTTDSNDLSVNVTGIAYTHVVVPTA